MRAARWAALALIVTFGVYLRVKLTTASPRFDAADGTGFFRAESAFQYRYARMLAAGQEVPRLDREAQHPEGVRPHAELTLLMERATAWTWRLFGLDEGFHRFVMLWVALISSLSAVAIYLMTGSLPAAALYGLSWIAVSSVAGAYGFQGFALPLIHFSLAFLIIGLERRGPWLLLAGLTLAAALASWHFTRFYFGTLVLALAWTAWREKEPGRLRLCMTVLLACAAAAGVLVENLRESRFLLSPSMVLGYALTVALHFPKRAKWIAGAAVAGLLLMTFSIPDGGAYGHVYGLLFEKLRHGLAKPADPARLNFHARLLWNGPFNSPDPGALVFGLVPALLILALRDWKLPPTPPRRLLDALTLLYAFGTLLVTRLSPFFLSFLAAGSALAVPRGRRAWALAALAGFELLKSLTPSSPWNPAMALSSIVAAPQRGPLASFAHERQLIEWLRANAEGVPVLANYGLSASLLAYAGTPVVLHPKFETAAIRSKTAAWLSALYSDEESLLRFIDKTQATLLVYSTDSILDDTPDGPRYASGSLRLTPRSPAVLMHFQPDRLKGLRLVYQNGDYRVFAQGSPGPKAPAPPIYDLSLYQPKVESDGSLTLDVRSINERVRAARQALMRARLLKRLGQTERALRAYKESFDTWPPEPAAQDEAQRLADSLPPRHN